ncbi:Arc family DNA-binding protein [Pyramidobacter piscolens]|uniref:Arc family DNA-binding protein n=1 Tax=Pyramidobacter piscolens TaxID=638849 RepID=UPI003AF95B02
MTVEMARFTLRIPQELYELVKDSADKNKRSVAKEIEFMLEQKFVHELRSKEQKQ